MKTCRKCSQNFSDNFDFCTICGEPLQNISSNKKKILYIPWLFLIMAILSIGVILIVYIFNENKSFSDTRQLIEDYKTDKIVSDMLATPDTSDIEIVDGWKWERDGNYIYIRGSVKNVSEKVISYFEITADFLNTNGDIIDSDMTNDGDELQPNTSRKFEIMHKYDSKFKKVKLRISDIS